MGQGTKRTPETPKAPADPGGAGEGGSPPTEFCAMEHTVEVSFTEGSGAVAGMPVGLGLGSPPRILGAGGQIGEVSDSLAGGLARCLLDGFAMSGVVDAVDLEGRRGQITVSGRKAT
jgi:hypothetical protein